MTVVDRPTGEAATRPPDSAEATRFPALDGVRAIAVLAVIGTHSAFWTGRYNRGTGAGLLTRLDCGVAVFFALSGFLLYRPWLLRAAGGRPVRTATYAWRRALRILPMYWLTVVLAMLLVPANAHATAADWLRQFGLVQIYRFGWLRGGLTQTWSLCTEVAFYAVLPLLGSAAAWTGRRAGWNARGQLLGCAALAAASIVWIALTAGTLWANLNAAALWLPTYLSWFAAGMALAVIVVDVERDPARWPRLRSVASSPGACWTLALALFLVVGTPVGGPRGISLAAAGTTTARELIYAAIAALIMLPCVLGASRGPQVLLANRPMRYLGRISYSMFLLHLMILEAVMSLLGNHLFSGSAAQVFLLTTALSVAASALAYRLVEHPVMRLRRLVPPVRGRDRTRPREPAR